MTRMLLLIIIGLILSFVTVSFSNEIASFNECEYAVTFPIPMKLTPVRTAGIESTIAITSSQDGMPILRAECQPLMKGAEVTKELIMPSLEEQAHSTGLNNVQVFVQNT